MRRRHHQQERFRQLGRLPALIGACAGLLLAGCDERDDAPSAPKSRAAAVQAKVPAPAAAPAVSPTKLTASAQPEPAQPKRDLCDGQLAGPGDPFPGEKLSRAGDPEPPTKIATGAGKWTWVNFWAAWCVPCKEEIPRLKAWEEKLDQSMRLAFVSIDDDERQLRDFVKAQPVDGLRSTYWLQDGKEREEWLTEAGFDEEPELPAHLLVDPSGKIRCRVQGAVEDSDFDSVAKLVGG